MNENETNLWRESVVISLTKIEIQLARLAADRESEKDALLRVTADLRERDTAIEQRLQKQLDEHRDYDDRRFTDADKYARNIAAKVYMGSGILAAILALWEALRAIGK